MIQNRFPPKSSSSLLRTSCRPPGMGPPPQPPSFFPTTALVIGGVVFFPLYRILRKIIQDHAAAGLGAGVVTTLCLNPLDLLKIKLQVTTHNPGVSIPKHIWISLKEIQQSQGWRGLYRGLVPNIAGNASSWGLYFLLCVAATCCSECSC